MSEAEMERLRNDLATMKHAVGVGLPFGREDIWANLAYAGAGFLVAGWLIFGPAAYAWLSFVPFILVAALLAPMGIKRSREIRKNPARVRELRYKGRIGLVVWLLVGVFLICSYIYGVPIETRISAIAFFLGLCILIFPLIDRTRFYYVGAAVATLLLGIFYPLCSRRGFGYIVLCGWVIVSCLSAAAIMTWQLRKSMKENGTD
ncbi:MAG: hypothetical protein ACYTBZ_26615 [Planctomycetota bacterium]